MKYVASLLFSLLALAVLVQGPAWAIWTATCTGSCADCRWEVSLKPTSPARLEQTITAGCCSQHTPPSSYLDSETDCESQFCCCTVPPPIDARYPALRFSFQLNNAWSAVLPAAPSTTKNLAYLDGNAQAACSHSTNALPNLSHVPLYLRHHVLLT